MVNIATGARHRNCYKKSGRKYFQGRNASVKMQRQGLLILCLFSALVFTGTQAFALPAGLSLYDGFSDGIDGSLWTGPIGTNPTFAAPVDGMLHISGSGGPSYPRTLLITTETFSGAFGAGITFSSFTQSGYTPPGGAPSYPSVSLAIGIWGADGTPTSPFYLVSRAVGADGLQRIGWRAVDTDGSIMHQGGVTLPQDSYSGDSGALILDYNPDEGLRFGYFTSTNPDDWTGDFTSIGELGDVEFGGAPSLAIIGAVGGGGSMSVDVGALYTHRESVPEPATLAFLLGGVGFLGLAGFGRRFKN